MAQRLSNEVRRKFVQYFASKNHKFVRSSSVVPYNDRSLEFVNAGMNQFKQRFLDDLPRYDPSRVCNYQKCIRVGGKTCDLKTIGYNLRHHSFFEMLGNWSFNDYGKHEACEWALDFLVNHLKLDMNSMRFTYHAGQDEADLETKTIWERLGVPTDHIKANNDGDNFWEMANEGPCGMSTEIFYPVGQELLEIWNLVFIDRKREAAGGLVPLKSSFVDTGMGLERVLAALEGVESSYDTDLFKSYFSVIKSKSNTEPYKGTLDDELDISYRILADHCRMITIALADGVLPGRRGAGFHLRSMIKRSLLVSKNMFEQETPRYLLFDLVDETVDILSEAYPELKDTVKDVRRSLAKESKHFLTNLDLADTING